MRLASNYRPRRPKRRLLVRPLEDAPWKPRGVATLDSQRDQMKSGRFAKLEHSYYYYYPGPVIVRNYGWGARCAILRAHQDFPMYGVVSDRLTRTSMIIRTPAPTYYLEYFYITAATRPWRQRKIDRPAPDFRGSPRK